MSVAEQPQRERIQDVVLLDVSHDARDAARDAADARLTQELNGGGRLSRISKSIWKGGIAREYYRQKYIQTARTEIEDSQDVLVRELGGDVDARNRAKVATIERFLSEYDESVHVDAGEQREILDTDSELTIAVKQSIAEYAQSSNPNDDALREEVTRVMNAYRESGRDDLKGEGIVQIDNVVNIACQVRSAIAHGEAIDDVLHEFNIVSGEARTNVRTAAKYDRVEKTIDRLHETKLGSLVPHEALVAGVSIAASVARFGSEKVMYAAAKTVSIGVGAGILSALRERKRVKDERVQHARELAQGKEFAAGSRRREEMEATRYETASAVDLATELERISDADFLASADNDALQVALDALAHTETVIRLSDQRNIDLISYSDVANIAEERFALDLARAEAKVALGGRLDDATRQALGLAADVDINEILEGRSSAFIEAVDTDASAKDQAFNKLRRRRSLQAGLRGAATGIVFGAVAQEVFASFSDTRAGAVERLWDADNQVHTDGLQHNTLINGAFEDGSSSQATIHHDPSDVYAMYETGKHGQIQLPEDYKLIHNQDGTVSIIDPNGEPSITSLTLNEDGSLPKESRELLRSHDITIENTSKDPIERTRLVSIEDYLDSKRDETVKVHRELWYDNDTPAPNFDKNELGMSWGGEENNGVKPNGDFAFTIQGMQAEGSYHGSESVDWHGSQSEGDIKLAVSATKDTQDNVFMLDVKPNGEVIIPKDSPAAALFENKDGQAVFKGAYAETVQITGKEEGVTNIRPLATVVGENNPGDIPVTTQVERPGYVLTPPGYETVTTATAASFTEMAPVIPIEIRRALENVKRRERVLPYGYGGYEVSSERRERMDQDRSPRLRDNPRARVSLGEELDWHDQLLRRNGGDEYVQDIERTIADTPELREISSDTRAIVTIPVGAALESENIYRTLSMYGQQDSKESIDSTMILLHVNWIDADLNNPDKAAKIQKTRDEIDRARRDYPDLRIVVMESEWSRAKLDQGGYGDRLIGHVSQKMYDVAMKSVKQGVDEGRVQPDDDVLIIKNDADALGMDKRYLEKMIRTFEEHPENDVFTGAIRWGAHRSRDLPGFGFVTQFNELTRIAAQRKNVDAFQSSFGVNTAVRMSSFAAVGGIGHYSDQEQSEPDDLAIGLRLYNARNANTRSADDGQSGRRRILARAKRRGLRNYGSSSSPAYVTPNNSGGANDYHRHVIGADIDTDADRMEEVYVQGKPITQTWDKVDKGNGEMRGRSEGLKRGEKEDLKNNPEAVIDRIEDNISALITHWITDPKQVAAGLAFMLRGPGDYSIRRRAGGRSEFRLTPEGKKWLINRLRRDSKGRLDNYGNRKMRALYSDVASSSVKRPNKEAPRMAGGILAYS